MRVAHVLVLLALVAVVAFAAEETAKENKPKQTLASLWSNQAHKVCMKRAAKKVEEEAFPTDDGFYTDVCGLIQKSVAEVAESSLSLVRSLRNMGDIDFASLLGRKFDSENTLKKRSMQPMYKTTGVKNIRKLITKYIRKSRELMSGTATNENDEEVPYTLEHLEEAIKKSTRDKLNMWFNNIVLNRGNGGDLGAGFGGMQGMEGMGGMKFNSPPKPAPRGDDVEEEIVDIDNTAHDEL